MSRPLHLIPNITSVQSTLALARRLRAADLIRSALMMLYVHQHHYVDFEVDLLGAVKLLTDDDKVHFLLKMT